MESKFEVVFLDDAIDFLESLDEKTITKIIYNIDKSRYSNDPQLFKKLTSLIWEFRTVYQRKQYRLLAFWDKEDENETLVISTHGFVKKTNKVAKKEIEKAENLRKKYFDK
ncbi:MAG: type II toxin-antitoxin system RelE/ParE family toxin [Chitinophagales bacterium]